MSPAGTTYLSGCYLLTQTVIPERHAYVLVTADGRQSYLVCNIEERSARREANIADIRTYVEFAEKPETAAAALLREQGLAGSRIGYEAHTLPAGSLATFKLASLTPPSFPGTINLPPPSWSKTRLKSPPSKRPAG